MGQKTFGILRLFQIQAMMILCSSTLQNMRWFNSSTSTTLLIITPFHESEIQAALLCSKKLEINVEEETAWVQSGTTLGELYYAIVEKSSIHAFPAGLCPTVGVGEHFSGGGFGTLLRKYGLAADNVLDAYLMDVN
ncbi:hypothetical protein CRYUN_Cryun36dG0043800 [Craigia yunnanensis]